MMVRQERTARAYVGIAVTGLRESCYFHHATHGKRLRTSSSEGAFAQKDPRADDKLAVISLCQALSTETQANERGNS